MEEARKRLVFALDVPGRKEAEEYVKRLAGSVGCFKVGLELFVKEGPEVLKVVRDYSSADIFLDLKLHDIPATLSRALISAASHKVKYATIHLEEGEALPKIPPEVKNNKLEVLAVTVLTSISEDDMNRYDSNYFEKKQKKRNKFGETFEYSKLKKIVVERAQQAQTSGCAGVICSGDEAELIKSFYRDTLKVVVPGIRPKWSAVASDDQSRTITPGQAIKQGADMIVVGRPIRTAKDPKKAADRIVEEISGSLMKK